MRRQLMIAGAWVASTGAAVTLSWFGVDAVVKGTVYDPPRALPITSSPADEVPRPDASSTQRPSPDAPETAPDADSEDGPDGTGDADGAPTETAAPESGVVGGSGEAGDGQPPDADSTGSGAGEPSTPPGRDSAPAETAGLGSVETVRTDGGRAAFDLGESAAELVSATPEPGWDMQVWTEESWIRVTFTSGGRELSVFCLWHDSAPRIELFEQ